MNKIHFDFKSLFLAGGLKPYR